MYKLHGPSTHFITLIEFFAPPKATLTHGSCITEAIYVFLNNQKNKKFSSFQLRSTRNRRPNGISAIDEFTNENKNEFFRIQINHVFV